MSRDKRVRGSRRSGRRARGLSAKPKLPLGADLLQAINMAIAGVVARHRTKESVPDPAVIAQALCLVTANLALTEGVSKEQLIQLFEGYWGQAEQLLGLVDHVEQAPSKAGMVTDGLIVAG